VTERFNFSVAYEPAALETAVRAYMWKALRAENGWIPTAAVFVIVVAASFFLFAQDFGLAAGAIAALVAVLVMALATYGWINWRAGRAKLAMMKEPRAVFVLSDEAVEMKTDRGSGRFPWATIRQIWKFKHAWLLMMDRNRFLTLPLADAPAGALQFLDQKVQPQSLGAA
jgi:hypothetical protein